MIFLILLCAALVFWVGFKFIGFIIKVTWSMTKGIIMLCLFPLAGIILLFCGLIKVALVLLIIGFVISLVSKKGV